MQRELLSKRQTEILNILENRPSYLESSRGHAGYHHRVCLESNPSIKIASQTWDALRPHLQRVHITPGDFLPTGKIWETKHKHHRRTIWVGKTTPLGMRVAGVLKEQRQAREKEEAAKRARWEQKCAVAEAINEKIPGLAVRLYDDDCSGVALVNLAALDQLVASRQGKGGK